MRFSLVLVLVVALSEGADVQPSCGRVSGSVGGQDVPPGRWPWFAGFYSQQSYNFYGSLISDQWVLTGAVYFRRRDLSDLTVVLGRTNQTGPNPNEVSRGINQTFCHPLFNENLSENDICLVQLSSPVELSDHISPVCLAAGNSTFPNGTFSWIIGPLSGDNKELMELQHQVLGNNQCQYRSPAAITDNKICTGYGPSNKGPCLLSFGAPLLILNDDLVWIQFGVSLSALMCRQNRLAPVYTRVSSYQDWIRSVTGSSQLGFVTFSSSGDGGVSASTSSPPGTNTTPTIQPPRTTPDRSIFSSSKKLSSTFFTSVSAVLFSLVLLVV